MSFNDPAQSGFPDIPDGQYVLQCVRIEDAEPGQFGARVRWVFNVWDAATKAPVTWEDGSPFEWFQHTGESTGPRSKARPWLEAFLAREVTPEDTGAGLSQEVIGKYALAMLVQERTDSGVTYNKIVSIKPYVKQAATPTAAPAPAPEPVAAAAAPAAAPPAANPFAGVDPDDSPF